MVMQRVGGCARRTQTHITVTLLIADNNIHLLETLAHPASG